MSFLKISDPAKRDFIVKEYLDLKKNIRDNLLSERTGEQQLQTDLSKFFKPITETQKATAREITEKLKPIKEGIENLPNAITFPTFPSIKATSEPTEIQDVQYIDDLARQYLMSFTTKENLTDKTFGIYSKGNNKFYIGDRNVKINGHDIIVLDNDGNVDKTCKGTPGLWELLVLQKPNEEIVMRSDLENYENLLYKTNSLYKNNDPNQNRPKGNYQGDSWAKVKKIWNKRKDYKGKGVVIPSDPNALLERLDLLLASQEAGHTGVGNELVSICDELKRQGVLDTKAYKKLNSIIKNDSP